MLPVSAIEVFWGMLRVEAGIEDVKLHDFRHNYASLAAKSSETLSMIGSLLGHENVRTTARYAHLDDAYLRETVASVGREIRSQLFER